jgi:hypothetical protein
MPVNPADRQFSDDDLRELFTTPAHMPERPIPAYMFDEGADHSSAPLIRELGVFVTTAQDQMLTGEKSDYRILAHARGLGCTLIVNDEAYENFHKRLMLLRLNHAGIIWIKLGVAPDRIVSYTEFVMNRSDEKESSNILYNQYKKIR